MAQRIIRRFERDIFPWIGSKPIAELAAPELLAAVRRIENRGALETAHRALGNCGQVFRYAIATGRATRDISSDLRGALPPVKGEHFAAITEPKQVGALLRAMDGYTGSQIVRCALRLAPLVFVRPGELRKAEWKDIDIDGAEWRYIVTKTDTPHIVPLSTQAVEILKELQALTGRSRFVFPGARTNGQPMSDNAILAAMRRMGIDKEEMSGHGFRAMARTILLAARKCFAAWMETFGGSGNREERAISPERLANWRLSHLMPIVTVVTVVLTTIRCAARSGSIACCTRSEVSEHREGNAWRADCNADRHTKNRSGSSTTYALGTSKATPW